MQFKAFTSNLWNLSFTLNYLRIDVGLITGFFKFIIYFVMWWNILDLAKHDECLQRYVDKQKCNYVFTWVK